MKTSPDEVAAALHLFFDEADVFEIRVLGADGNAKWKKSTYCRGRHIDHMAGKIAAAADTAVAGVHFTPQVVNPVVAKRSLCCLSPVGRGQKLTSDDDVTRRRFLLIDVDPVRAAGFEGDSATDAEKSEAWRVLAMVGEYFDRCHWPRPVVVDSGNGFHAYYRMPETIHGGAVDSMTDPVAICLRRGSGLRDRQADTATGGQRERSRRRNSRESRDVGTDRGGSCAVVEVARRRSE